MLSANDPAVAPGRSVRLASAAPQLMRDSLGCHNHECTMSPEDLLDHIGSRDDFLRFLDALLADHKGMERKQAEMPSSPYGPAAGGWENVRLGSFLEAMGAWARDADLSETASWRAFAQLLLAGKGYE